MNNKYSHLFYLLPLFTGLLAVSIYGLKLNSITSSLIALGAVAITIPLISTTKEKREIRSKLFCAWGLIFAGMVFISNLIQHGHFICPSKIPLIGENAGSVPKIPDSNALKSILPCPLGIFQNYMSSFTNTGFLTSTLVLSIQLFGTIFFIWLLIAAILGRSWCGWICPFGGLIESFSRISPKTLWKVDIKSNTANTLRFGFLFGVVFLILAATKAPSYSYCLLCPMKGVYHSPDYWNKIFTVHTEFITYYGFITLFLLLPLITKRRVWCSMLCPLGALTSIAGTFSIISTRVDSNKCNECRKCIDSCKLLAITGSLGAITIDSSTCANCSDCMNICPKQAIRYFIRGTNIEIKNSFFSLIIACSIIIAVMLVLAMCKPILSLY